MYRHRIFVKVFAKLKYELKDHYPLLCDFELFSLSSTDEWKITLNTYKVAVQGHKRATVSVIGCGFDSHSR